MSQQNQQFRFYTIFWGLSSLFLEFSEVFLYFFIWKFFAENYGAAKPTISIIPHPRGFVKSFFEFFGSFFLEFFKVYILTKPNIRL